MIRWDKRQHKRTDCSLSIFLIDIESYNESEPINTLIEAKAFDISDQGLRVKCSLDIAKGAFICALVFFEGTKSLCFGQVRWKKREGKSFYYGLYFKQWTALNPALATLLDQSNHAHSFFSLRSLLSPAA